MCVKLKFKVERSLDKSEAWVRAARIHDKETWKVFDKHRVAYNKGLMTDNPDSDVETDSDDSDLDYP